MGFNFPNAPTIGQLHPDPATVGLPQYQWNGSEWVTPAYNPLDYVRKSGDSMTGALLLHANATAALQAVPKQQLETYAAPLDAMAYSGMQINGSMEVSQELGNTAITVPGYMCDGWFSQKSGTMVLTSQRVAAAYAYGLNYTLAVVVATASPALAAGDFAQVVQIIEGWRIARLAWGYTAAKPITIAFWSAHARTGLHSIVVGNADGTRSYAAMYTQAVANTSQYNVVTIPGCPDGVWNADNSGGIVIHFAMAAGTTFTAPTANVWHSTNYVAGPGQVNAVAATADVFRITGVVVLPGTQAPTAAQSPLIMRPYGQELLACQRYFEWCPFSMQFYSFITAESFECPIRFAVDKRATPTLSLPVADPNGPGALFANVAGQSSALRSTTVGCSIIMTSNTTGSVYAVGYRFSADARF